MDVSPAVSFDKIARAALSFFTGILGEYKNPPSGTPETILGACAALTGEFSLRAAIPDHLHEIGADFVVLEKDLPSSLFDGKTRETDIHSFMLFLPLKNGLARSDDLPDPVEISSRQIASIGNGFFPNLSVPREHFPRNWSPATNPQLRGFVLEISKDLGLKPEEIVAGLAFATGLLISTYADRLAITTAFRLAADIAKGTSLMVPWETKDGIPFPMGFDPDLPKSPRPAKVLHIFSDPKLIPGMCRS